jgi:beta-barrel assembly-enhancing protease
MHSDLQTIKSVDFLGRMNDGKTAATGAVVVRFGAQDLEIFRAEPDPSNRDGVPIEPSRWPYPGLSASASLTAKAADVLLTSIVTPGATLFVDDRNFVRMLSERAPHLNARRDRLVTAAPWLAMSAVIVAGIAALWGANISPARIVAGIIPDRAREAMGKQVITSMSDKRPICSAPAGRAALDKLTSRLSVAANAKFDVIVVDWSLLNAFAAPGEQILLTRELVQNARSSDEVAAVLAHEMGHGLERHPETGVVRMIGMSAAIELMMGGSGGTLANVGLLLAQLNYTRAAEQEADDHSYRILRAAGISSAGISDFFKRAGELEEKSEVAKKIGQFDILRTHPQSAERVKRALSQPDYPTTPALNDADWQALKQICGPQSMPKEAAPTK